ncbi:MAG: hypothetical protein DHS20C19_26180 [Acidimicrobiales bacterium]|nr:MAG: hypothetical protein DHS20C19_26180 [Acidimicrobiales bacterium]
MSLSNSSSPDELRIDLGGARELVHVLSEAADGLRRDHGALAGLLDDAAVVLHRDRREVLVSVLSATERMDSLAGDLGSRLVHLHQLTADNRAVDELSARLRDFRGPPNDPARAALERERYEIVLRLVDGDERIAIRVVGALGGAASVDVAYRSVLDALIHESRVDAVMEGLGLDLEAAEELIARRDAAVAALVRQGHREADAVAVVSLAEEYGLDADVLGDRALTRDISVLDATREGLLAKGMGLTLDEFDGLMGLQEHFAVFDTASFTEADGRVSTADLRFVVAEPCHFTDAQVRAAELLLASPRLLSRLDTANANDDIFGDADDAAPVGFGSVRSGDGLIADVDLQAFMLKSQLHSILGPYADQIDIGDDPKAIVDGYRSEADIRAFLADNPELPPAVMAAAETMIAGGWFDESWWQENKNTIAMGAALAAGGLVLIATSGGASALVVGMAGAAAGATTTAAINLGTDDDLLDDMVRNTTGGFVVALGVHGMYAGLVRAGPGATALARAHGVAEATGGGTDLILSGSLDPLIADDWEETVKDWATPVNTVATAVDIAASGIVDRLPMATYDTLEEQLAVLNTQISRQKQLRHLEPTVDNGGYFIDAVDAQRVLDAVHDGSAEILGRRRGGHIVVRVDDIFGTHVTNGTEDVMTTDVFMIKGTAHPSVVPTNPTGGILV